MLDIVQVIPGQDFYHGYRVDAGLESAGETVEMAEDLEITGIVIHLDHLYRGNRHSRFWILQQ